MIGQSVLGTTIYRARVLELLRRHPTEDEARELATWAHPPPFDLYDAADPATFLATGSAGEGCYPAVDDDGRLVAFAVLGAEARVLGQEPADGVVDVGIGVRPDLTSRGLGGALVGQVLQLAADLTGATTARVAVAAFNERSLALCRSARFEDVREFSGPGGRPFRELVRRLDAPLRAEYPG